MISDIKTPEIEIHFPASRRRGGVNEYRWPSSLVWLGVSWVSVSLPLLHHARGGPSDGFASPLVLKVKGLGAMFSNRIAVLAWI